MTNRDPNRSTGLLDNQPPVATEQQYEEMPVTDSEEIAQAEELAARERTVARLRLLWDARGFLVRVALCGLLLSAVVAFLLPKQYQSTLRLMPPEQSGSGLGGMLGSLADKAGTMGPLADSVLAVKTTSDLFLGILQSATVQDDLIQKFGLQKVYSRSDLDDARGALAKHTELLLDRKSGILTIKVTDAAPQRAAAMGQEYVDRLNWVVSNLSTSSARRERLFLEERLKEVRADLQSTEQQFSEFASKQGTIDIQSQGKAMFEAAARLQGELIAAESELGGLRQIYAADNVRVRSLEARVAELRRQLQKMGGRPENPNSSADDLYPSIRQLPLVGVNYADLQRRVRVQEAVFVNLTREYEMAKVQEAKEIPSVQVLDPPMVPQKKAAPSRMRIMLLGALVALVIGIAWVFGKAVWQEAVPRIHGKFLPWRCSMPLARICP